MNAALLPAVPAPTPLHDYLFRQRAIPHTDIAPGIATPLRFTDRHKEHAATRGTVGLFDFSFMACFDIAGPQAATLVDRVQTRAAWRMHPGQVTYTLLCRDDGTVLNDATLWCRGEGLYSIFTGRRTDVAHLRRHAAKLDVTIDDVSDRRAVLAVQGPLALRTLQAAIPAPDWESLRYFHFRSVDFEGSRCDIARLGYSGEAGFEAVIDAACAPRLWQRLASVGAPLGIAECGFEAADMLRIEAGFILFARELALPVTPQELRLDRLVSPPGARFAGAEALRSLRRAPPSRCLAGFDIDPRGKPPPEGGSFEARATPRPGEAVLTSVTTSPLYQRCIGIGFVSPEDRHAGARVRLQTGHAARVTRLPFYDPPKLRPLRHWTSHPDG